MTPLSSPSRITSSSNSFQPAIDSSTRISFTGEISRLAGRERGELLAVGREAAAAAPHRERSSHDQRVADRIAQRRAPRRACAAVPARGTSRPALSIASLNPLRSSAAMDRLERGTDQPDAETVEVARLRERDRDVQGGLAAERGQQRVGALPLADRQHRRGRERLDVGAVRERRVGHDRRRDSSSRARPRTPRDAAPCRPACPSSRTRMPVRSRSVPTRSP